MLSKLREGGFLITQVNHRAAKIFSDMLAKQNIKLKHGEGRVLFTIWSNNGIAFGDVVKKTLLPKSTLAETLDRLENAGYVKRITDDDDRRKVLLRITDKTKGFQKVLLKVSEEMTRTFYNGFESEEIDLFEKYLRRILENLS
jgi:DNA-binding MarR family transcriptional regulator